MTIKKQS